MFLTACQKTITPSTNDTVVPIQVTKNIALSKEQKECVVDYNNYLKSLPLDNLDSIGMAIDKYKTLARNYVQVNDQMFRAFRTLYYQVLQENSEIVVDGEEIHRWDRFLEVLDLNENIDFNNTTEIEKIDNGEVKEKLTKLIKNGYIIDAGEEDSIIIKENYEFLINEFSGYISIGMDEFLKIKKKFLSEELYAWTNYTDILITWDELSDRIIVLENYINKHKDYLEEIREVQNLLDEYLNVYTTADVSDAAMFSIYDKGLDREEVDYKNDNDFGIEWEVSSDVLRSYERFIEIYEESKYRDIIKAYYEILIKNESKFNKESVEFLEENEIEICW